MHVNADFTRPAVVNSGDTAWLASPAPGVDRIMLDRIGDEVARATSIVRYAAGSAFARHEHAKGEEFLVLEGVFSDESGHYPAGTYVRNPPGSGHSPFSDEGCRILVKLRQFDPDDLTPVVVDTRRDDLWGSHDEEDPIRSLDLHRYGSEKVEMLRVAAGTAMSFGKSGNPGGLEIFVVEGSLAFDGQTLPAESWLRMPPDSDLYLETGDGCTLWIKRGHLPVRG